MTDPETAVAIAEGAVEGAQGDAHLRSRLSETYRELAFPDPVAAEATCRDFFTRFPDRLMNDIRPLIGEWAVACGECRELPDHGARSVWLALLSFSDQAGGTTVPPEQIKHLPTVTMGLTLVNEGLTHDMVTRAAAAILAAGSMVPGTPHLDTARRLAGEEADTVSESEVGSSLSALSQAAWGLIDQSFREQPCLPRQGALTFAALRRAIAEAGSGSRGAFGPRGRRRYRRR
jgi:hypothetical protein